jgi:sugar phosphate isomerase/epimerase
MVEAMTSRLLPGDGVVDFPALLAGLAAIEARPFVATEVFNPSLVADRGPAGAATAMRDAVEDGPETVLGLLDRLVPGVTRPDP